MGRLNKRDESGARELARSLGRIEEGAAPVLATFVRELRSVLGTDRTLAYAVAPAESGYELRFGHWSGYTLPSAELNRMMVASLARARGPWALYDPRRPEGPQRNRVVVIPKSAGLRDPAAGRYLARMGLPPRERERFAARMSRLEQQFLRRVGMDDLHVCRALVCDGDRVLAWVGACQPTSFGHRERAMLGALVAPLQRRLRSERLLGEGPLAVAALPALLEAIPAAAFVLARNAAIQHANAAGIALLGADARATREALAAAVRGQRGEVELSAIVAPGLPPSWLAIVRRSAHDAAARLETARLRWSLTRREVEVLERLVDGDGNKEIAAQLGVTTRAVELHVTRLLEKLRVNGRAALAGRFWHD